MTFRDLVVPDGLRLQRDFREENRQKGKQSYDIVQSLSGSTHLIEQDELSRPVFGVLGVPLDVLDLATLLNKIRAAVEARTPFLLSTPNVNFLMMSQSDVDF